MDIDDEITHQLGLPPDWRRGALCAQVGGDSWFADKGGGAAADTDVARGVCRRCPARAACLEWVLAFEAGEGKRHRHGVWAATTPQERIAIEAHREQAGRVHA